MRTLRNTPANLLGNASPCLHLSIEVLPRRRLQFSQYTDAAETDGSMRRAYESKLGTERYAAREERSFFDSIVNMMTPREMTPTQMAISNAVGA